MIIKVRVIPGAPENEVVSRIGSVLRVQLKTSKLDDDANKILKVFLADFFDVKTSYVNIIRGAKGREKTVEISGQTEENLKKVMESIP